MTVSYFDCPDCRKAFRLVDTDPMECPHCGHDFSPFPKGSTAGGADHEMFLEAPDVPEEIEETLGEELRDTFLKLLPKMVQGKIEHSDFSLELPLHVLLAEIDDELLDVFGWGVIARRKVNVLRGVIKILEQRVADLHIKAHPVYVVSSGAKIPERLRELMQNMESGQVLEYEPGVTWLTIESAPKDGTTVLLWSPGCPRAVSHWCKGEDGEGCWLHYGQHTPTHWHPLPDPPDGTLYQGPKREKGK